MHNVTIISFKLTVATHSILVGVSRHDWETRYKQLVTSLEVATGIIHRYLRKET